MTLSLTPDNLLSCYDFLNETEPFRWWNLPDGEEIVFAVSDDPNHCGWLTTKRRRKPRITISRATVGHTATLVAAMAHEMGHLHQYLTGMPQTHGSGWEKIKDDICKHHGFDPKLF